MASGRSSPLRKFKQPLSPMMEPGTSHAQQRLRQQRQPSGPGAPGQLRLPGLPRFHPANFPSAASSMANTPTSGVNSPQPPMSPRSQQRQFSDAQRQLLNYQRDIFAQKRTVTSTQKPSGPQLMPLAGSPGPVTPLELEGESYLTVGAGIASNSTAAEYVDNLIRDEAARRAESSHGGPAPLSTY